MAVREVHADQLRETKLLPKPFYQISILLLYALYARIVDYTAHVRIFNHPDLMDWYGKNIKKRNSDFFCYNGFSPEICFARHAPVEIHQKYGLDPNNKYFVFTGSVASWHGVDLLSELQLELNKRSDKFVIICAGGKIKRSELLNSGIINISPLGEEGCMEIISIAFACLLPVKAIRISPGSPLKLYDYIAHDKVVVAQSGTRGYADENERYGRGVNVNFLDPASTADTLINLEPDSLHPKMQKREFSWEQRMLSWVSNLASQAN